jgi:hypothetical protein
VVPFEEQQACQPGLAAAQILVVECLRVAERASAAGWSSGAPQILTAGWGLSAELVWVLRWGLISEELLALEQQWALQQAPYFE